MTGMDHLFGLAADCLADRHGFGIGAALLLAGLVGGFAHCAGMCGPFVLAQVAASDAGGPAAPGTRAGGLELRRLATGTLPGYQLGRLTTYTMLGAAAGGLGGTVLRLGELHWLAAAFLGAASILFLVEAVRGSLTLRFLPSSRLTGRMARLIARGAAPLLGAPGPLRRYILGVTLGFLPCGMLYAALAAAGATGDAGVGAVAMAGFAIGTMPALALVGVLGSLGAVRWRQAARLVVRPVFLLNAATLAVMAWHRLG